MNRVYQGLHGKADQKRVLTLSKMLYAIIKSGQSSLSRIGMDLPGATDLESRVKQAKRWLDSKYSDYDTFFLPHIQALLHGLSDQRPLVLAIDSSEVGRGCRALMVSVVWRKRALPVCWLVSQGKKGHMPVELHLDIVNKLADVLLDHPQVVLLGDGEFDSGELQAFCEQQGWKYVFRTAKSSLITTASGEAWAIGELYPMPDHEYWLIEHVYFTQQRHGPLNGLIWHSPKYEAPIYLISNLDWAKDIRDYYTRRFSIETIFGDMKSPGFNLHKVRISRPERLNALLMVICIAFLLVFALASFQESLRPYLPRFIRKDRTDAYSCFQVGHRAFRFFIKEHMKIFPQYCNNYLKYICVRF